MNFLLNLPSPGLGDFYGVPTGAVRISKLEGFEIETK